MTITGQRCGSRDEDHHRAIRCTNLRPSAIGTIESQGSLGLKPACRLPITAHRATRREARRSPARQDSGAGRHSAARREHGSERVAVDSRQRPLPRRLRARPRSVTAVGSDETQRSAAGAAASAASRRPRAPRCFGAHYTAVPGFCSAARNISHSDNEAVERRKRRDRDAADQNHKTLVSGMRWMRPPSLSMSRSPVAGQHGAGAEEQQAHVGRGWLSA